MISLAHLTAVDADPVQLIHMAAETGYDAVGLRLTKVTEDSPGYPLMDDPHLLKQTLQAAKQTGVMVNDIEFIKVTPDLDVASLNRLLDTGHELGAKKLITAPYDDDLSRLSDKLAQIAQLAQQRNIQTLLEFFPGPVCRITEQHIEWCHGRELALGFYSTHCILIVHKVRCMI